MRHVEQNTENIWNRSEVVSLLVSWLKYHKPYARWVTIQPLLSSQSLLFLILPFSHRHKMEKTHKLQILLHPCAYKFNPKKRPF